MHQHSKPKKKQQRQQRQQQQQLEWGEPKYHAEYKRYYREAVDQDGHVQYDWLPESYRGPTEQDRPRSDFDVLATGVGNLDLGGYPESSNVAADQGYPASPGYTHTTPHAAHSQEDSIPHGDAGGQYAAATAASLPPENNPSYQSDKGKGKAYEQYDSGSSTSHYAAAEPYAELQSQYTYADNVFTRSHSRSNDYGYGPTHTTDTTYSTQEESEYEAAIRQSRDQYYGHPTYGEPSNAYATASSAYAAPDPPAAYGTSPAILDDSGNLTPRATSPVIESEDLIRGTAGDFERLDPRYRVEHSSRFKPGAVFKVLWAEPMGATCTGTDDPISEIHHTNEFYYGIRRFIVVATDEGNSTCVPILTYEKRACTKKGVKASKHGVVYSKGHSPKPIKNEPRLGFYPVEMKIYAPDEKLARESRVNYSKLVTIEHNVKVLFIGAIEGEDFEIVQNAVDHCWTKKWKKSKRW